MSEKINKKQEEILKLVDKISEKLKKEKTMFLFPIKTEKFLSKVKKISFENKYALWIIQRYIDNGIQRYEDLGRVETALDYYHRHKQKIDIKDRNIMNIKSLVDLENIVEPFVKLDEQKELEKLNKEKIYSETEFLYEGPDCKVLIPKTEEASVFWGQGTRWCTASTKNNMFEFYNKQGNLIIFVLNKKDKNGREIKYQMHLESEQFMDSNDISFESNLHNNFENFSENMFFKKLNHKNSIAMLENFGFLLPLFENPTENMIIAAISSNSELISKLENPSFEMIKYVIEKNTRNILHIKNLNEKILLKLIEIDKEVLEYTNTGITENTLVAYLEAGGDFWTIKNKCENVLKINFKDLINNVPTNILLNAIKKNPLGISYLSGIHKKSEELEWAALFSSPQVISKIQNPSKAMLIFALKNNIDFYKIKEICANKKINFDEFVDNIPFDVLAKKIKKEPYEIIYISEKHQKINDLKWISIRSEPKKILNFKKVDDDMRLFVLKEYPEYIGNITNPTEEMIATAFLNNKASSNLCYLFQLLGKKVSTELAFKIVKKIQNTINFWMKFLKQKTCSG